MTEKTSPSAAFSRRQVLSAAGTGALTAFAISLLPGKALAESDATKKFLSSVVGDAGGTAGKIKLDLPQIAENGNTVPVTVSVDAPMGADNYVKTLVLAADGNPSPEVAVFHFTPLSGKAKASLRMRLAKTQDIVAVAQTSGGDVFTAAQQIKVTIGGCGG